jgi:hypothetical protein
MTSMTNNPENGRIVAIDLRPSRAPFVFGGSTLKRGALSWI